LILFGGRSAATLNDTWVYDLAANAWHVVTGSIAPEARYGAGAAYDFARKHVVIFGGQSATKFFNDVWVFDVATEKWSKLTTIGTAPTARSSMAIAIDPPYDQLIISQGATAQGRTQDTWSLALASKVWQNFAPTSQPEARSQSGAVFDSNHHRLIVFGGLNTTGTALNDQWSLDPIAQVWKQFGTIAPGNPAARSGSTLVYDPISYYIFLFGGKTIGGASKEVWSLDPDNNWLSIGLGSGPIARSNQAAAWDSINHRMIVFGGLDANTKSLNDLWAFTP
jgi:N-acetylneuraminic acid mutarotase